MPKQPAGRLRRIEQEVCRDLNLSPDDELCRHVSTLRLMRENMQAKLVLGERVDPDDLLRVDAALKAYLPQGKPATIEVKVVDGLHATCPRCGYNTPVDSARTAETLISEAPDAIAQGSTVPTPAPVPPVSVQREGISASKFHSQLINGHEVAPLKRTTSRLISPLSKGY
jgi:hypothetical protein